MVGLPYDCIANPLGAVRLSFERAVAALPAADPSVAFNGRDWGALDLFRDVLFNQGGISQVPFLDDFSRQWIQPNSLVRFRGMVQDMFGNELYIGAFKDGLTWRTNKFQDVSSIPMPSAWEPKFWERRLFYCVPVPGQNLWTSESTHSQVSRHISDSFTSPQGVKRERDADISECNEDGGSPSSSKKQKEAIYPCQLFESSEGSSNQGGIPEPRNKNSLSCLVKICDLPEGEIKLNDVCEFIGIYTFDPELAIHKDDADDVMPGLLDNALIHLPPSKVPRIHCLICQKLAAQDFLPMPPTVELLPNVITGVRESLLRHFTNVLGNDGLAAEYLLLHLLSRVRARVDVASVGHLSLNLTGFTRESSSIFGDQLIRAIQNLLPFSQSIPLTLEFLNTAVLRPRKNNQTGRLVAGVLQLAQGTHLTIDETHLQNGVLNPNGVENARLLEHLIKWQTVDYDFEYYMLEMATDVQLLILSEGKSNILPADTVLPFRPITVSSDGRPSSEELQSWRWYLATLRSLPHSSQSELQQILQDDMVAAMRQDRSLSSTDLNRWMTMAQLVSASFGVKELSPEHWQMVRELERRRKERFN